MAAIYSNGGNRWNILGFNFTKMLKTLNISLIYIGICNLFSCGYTCSDCMLNAML